MRGLWLSDAQKKKKSPLGKPQRRGSWPLPCWSQTWTNLEKPRQVAAKHSSTRAQQIAGLVYNSGQSKAMFHHTVEKQHEDTSPSPFWVLLQVHFSRTEQLDPVISVSLQVNTVCCVTKIYSTAALLQAQNTYLPSPLVACTLVVCVRKSEPILFHSTCKKCFF